MANPNAPGIAITMFDEDFDEPSMPLEPPEPRFVEPVFTAADVATAREEAARIARDAAEAEAETSASAAIARALDLIAARVAAARDDAAQVAEESAEMIARLLLDCFATAFPALAARHGASEMTAVIDALIPTLRQQTVVTVRLNPRHARAARTRIEDHDPDLAASVRLIPNDAIDVGDVRVTWEGGNAVRDARALWRQIEAVLAPAGLVSPARAREESALVE